MVKKRIILFYPIGWKVSDDVINKGKVQSIAGIPLSILATATFLEEDRYGINVISGAEKNYVSKIKNLLSTNTICFGISSMTGYQIKQGLKISKIVREYDPKIPIIWGGFHPSILAEQTAESPYVDFVVRSYGEKTFVELISALENGDSFDQIKGITFKNKQGEIISTEDRPIEDINNFLTLPYHLVDVPRFFSPELGDKTIGYVSSRGCPNHCSFCADKFVYGAKWNALKAQRVVDDLKMLRERYGINAVRIMDSNFFVNENRVRLICKGIIENELDIKWGRVNGSAEILVSFSEETWQLMEAAGCHSIAVGAESGYIQALNILNKRATIEDVKKLSVLGKKHNIRLLYTFMLGVPISLTDYQNQRKHFQIETAKTLELIESLMEGRRGLDRPVLFRFALYPGNSLYEGCEKFGWKKPVTLEEWADINLFTSPLPWLTPEESKIIDSLVELVKLAFPPITG